MPHQHAMPGLTKNEWKGLWAILWRVLIFGPILGILGLAVLLLVIAAFVAPPPYAALAFLTGEWLKGAAKGTGTVRTESGFRDVVVGPVRANPPPKQARWVILCEGAVVQAHAR